MNKTLAMASVLLVMVPACSLEPTVTDDDEPAADGGLEEASEGLATCTRADPAHIRRLEETKVCDRCCLKGADLPGVNLRYGSLRGADLSCANLAGADLRQSNHTGADFRGANLTASQGWQTGQRDRPGRPLTLACAGHQHDVEPNLAYALPRARCGGGAGAPLYAASYGPPSARLGLLPSGARVTVLAPDTANQRAKVQVIDGGCDRALSGLQGWVSYTHLLAN